MTLAVTGAPDSHRGPIFLADPDGQRGPDSLTGFSVGFRTHFVAYVMVSVASAWVLALTGLRPAGPETPKGAHALSVPWLRPCPIGHVPAGRICTGCSPKIDTKFSSLYFRHTCSHLNKRGIIAQHISSPLRPYSSRRAACPPSATFRMFVRMLRHRFWQFCAVILASSRRIPAISCFFVWASKPPAYTLDFSRAQRRSIGRSWGDAGGLSSFATKGIFMAVRVSSTSLW